MQFTPRAALGRLSRSIAFRVRSDLAPLVEQQGAEVRARLEAIDHRLAEIEHGLQALEALEGLEALRTRLETIESTLALLGDLPLLRAELVELKELAQSDLELENEKAELFGRLLRAATSRVDELEERLVDDR